MLINGWNISNADAKQWTVVKGLSNVVNSSSWADTSVSPSLLGSKLGFKELKITFMVYGTTREDVHKNISLLFSKLSGVVDLTLDNWSTKFKGALKSTPTIQEWTAFKKRCSKATFVFNGYEYGSELTFSGRTRVTIENPGTAPTPLIITLSGAQAAGNVKISGLKKNITVPVKSGHTYTLDGESGLFTDNGELMDLDIWGLPYVENGTNVLSMDSSLVSVFVKIKPRYL